MLGYKNPQKALRDHCSEKGGTIRSALTNGGKQSKKYVNEDNLYRGRCVFLKNYHQMYFLINKFSV